jgi:hypothetical protein
MAWIVIGLASTRQSRLTISATPSRARTRGRAGGRLNPDTIGQRITTNGADGPTAAALVATDTGKERRHARRRGKILTGNTTSVPPARLPKWANAWNQNAQVTIGPNGQESAAQNLKIRNVEKILDTSGAYALKPYLTPSEPRGKLILIIAKKERTELVL